MTSSSRMRCLPSLRSRRSLQPAEPKKPAEPGRQPPPEDEDLLEDEEEPLDPGPAPEDREFLDEEEGERTEEALGGPGIDTLDIYRHQEKVVKGMQPDEEIMAWEAYLAQYPNSLYRKVIEDRIDELMTKQFQTPVGTTTLGGEDANQQELLFVQPLGMTNVNPRTAVQLAVAFGFPTYVGMRADFEYAFKRNISAHAGFMGRYAGWGLDVGARWAFVKSTKLQFVGTLVTDIGVSFSQRVSQSIGEASEDPNVAYFLARPQLAFGKIAGPVQILLNVGTEIGSRKNQGAAVMAGLHVGARVAPPVGVFVESDVYTRNLGREGAPFVFSVVSFGFKFYPLSKKKGDPLEIGMGGHLPYATKYLQFYQGAVQAQGTYYLNL